MFWLPKTPQKAQPICSVLLQGLQHSWGSGQTNAQQSWDPSAHVEPCKASENESQNILEEDKNTFLTLYRSGQLSELFEIH